jgi:hypothetical protein
VDACLQQLTAKGYQVSGAAVDVSDLAQRQQLVQQVSAAFDGKLNILGGAHSVRHGRCAGLLLGCVRTAVTATVQKWLSDVRSRMYGWLHSWDCEAQL